jgi:hypothetical protein
MAKKGEINSRTLQNIANILELLRTREQLHLRGISKALNINQGIVSRIVDNYLDFFVDIRSIDQFGFRAKLIRLKEGKEATTIEDILKYLKVKEQIKGQINLEPRIAEAFTRK